MKKGPAKGVARAHWPTATETVAQRWGAGDAVEDGGRQGRSRDEVLDESHGG